MAFQTSGTPVRDHPQTHLDPHGNSAAEQGAELERLIAPGATRVDGDGDDEGGDFVVLADTEGNRFRVVDLRFPR